jgi:hypothetical protein
MMEIRLQVVDFRISNIRPVEEGKEVEDAEPWDQRQIKLPQEFAVLDLRVSKLPREVESLGSLGSLQLQLFPLRRGARLDPEATRQDAGFGIRDAHCRQPLSRRWFFR